MPDPKACCPIEHPCRNIHAPCGLFRVQVTAKGSLVAPLDDFVDIDCPTQPGVPRIKHLQSFGHMGFAAFTCTIRGGRIRRSAIAARVSSAGYNINLWLDSGGALQIAAPTSERALNRQEMPPTKRAGVFL